MEQGYIKRRIVKETQKAYLVEQQVNNRRDGMFTNFKWVAKSQCKNFFDDVFGDRYVDVPEWLVGNGVWGH